MKHTGKELLSKSYEVLDLIKNNKSEFLYAFLALVVCCTFSLVLSGQVIELFQSRVPYEVVFAQNTPDEMFIVMLKLTLLMGTFLAFPFFLYRFFKVKIKNYDKTKKIKLIKFLSLSGIMNLAGILTAYFVTIPIQLFFLLGLNVELVDISLNISSYISFCLGSVLLACLVCHFPLIFLLKKKNAFYSYEELNPLRNYIMALSFILAFIIISPPELLSLLSLTTSIIIFYFIVIKFIKK